MDASGDIDANVSIQMNTTPESNSTNDGPQKTKNPKGFWPLFIIAQVLGIAAVALTLTWLSKYPTPGFPNSFGFKSSNVFNWHPIVTPFAFVYLAGNSLLIFQLLRNTHVNRVRVMYGIVKALNCIIGFFGLWAAYAYHSVILWRHLFSMHSWMGLLMFVLFVIEASIALLTFVHWPHIGHFELYHKFATQALFVLATATAVTGINHLAQIKLNLAYSELGPQAVIMNLTGILYILFAAVILYLATHLDDTKNLRLKSTPASSSSKK